MGVHSLELNYKIQVFDLYRKRESKQFKEKEILQEKFVKDFPIEKIYQLKIDDYIQGKGSKKSYCYRIETRLVKLGNMKGATSHKFGIYFGKDGNDKRRIYRFTKKFGYKKEEALSSVKSSIIDLLIAGKNKNRDKINSSKLAPIFRYKLLATYYPSKFLNIYSEEHLDFFLSELGINVSTNKMYDKQMALLEYKKENKITNEWSNNEFNSFLYNTFGKPPTNKKEKYILEVFPPIEKVKVKFLNKTKIDKINNKISHNKKIKNDRKIDYKIQNDRNNRLGLRGENIIFNLEKKFFEEHKLNTNALKHISKTDDTLGYDILSLDKNGEKKYIEVKSTRNKPEIANFIITSNEKEKATLLKNYYIYLVFEAHSLHPKIIKIKEPFKKYVNKMTITPINYRVVFDIKSINNKIERDLKQ